MVIRFRGMPSNGTMARGGDRVRAPRSDGDGVVGPVEEDLRWTGLMAGKMTIVVMRGGEWGCGEQ